MRKSIFVFVALFQVLVFANNAKAQQANEDLVSVYRWLNVQDNNYVTLANGEIQEGQLLQWKYKDKTFLFYAYKTPGPDRVAVYRWENPLTKDFASIAEDEMTDSDMQQKGYTGKKLQFYAPIRREGNHVPVYRWYKAKSKDWVTIPEVGNTDSYIDRGYKMKTFQFYGIIRSEYQR
ncbi:MAG: hypothetical protein IPI46_12055 [Bacteroidetes bacterium]|nr:hypothetical protein [Bacteroidota bacterium]